MQRICMRDNALALEIKKGMMSSKMRRQRALSLTLNLLFLCDLLVVLSAFLLGFYLRFDWLPSTGLLPDSGTTLKSYMLHILIGTLVMMATLYLSGMYRLNLLSRYRYGALRVFQCVFYWILAYIFIESFLKLSPELSRLSTLYTSVCLGVGLFALRYSFCLFLLRQQLLQIARRQTIVIGWNDQVEELYELSKRSNTRKTFFPFRLRAIISWNDANTAATKQMFQSKEDKPLHLSGERSLERLIRSGNYDTVLLANTDISSSDIFKIQEICGREMIDFMIIPSFVQILTSCLHVETFQSISLLTQTKRKLSRTSNRLLKRVFDVMGASIGLAASVPIIAYFGWRVHRESPGPIFYYQERLGKDGKPFKIIKIRSMRINAEAKGVKWTTREDSRRLQVGSFMRKYNIDELPQFWNVLKGHMSLVGPRPERPEWIKDFKHEISYYNVRHTVKPGITGWAQVNGWRGNTCLKSRVACDIEYIERWSLWFDFYICLRTLITTKNAY